VAVIFLAVAAGSHGRAHCVAGAMAIVAVLSSVACVALGRFTEQSFGGKDPGRCTIDEWAGQAVAMLFLPIARGDWRNWLIVAGASFVLFRILDIVKPPPARWLEKLPRGWGILADDLAAGAYALAAVQLLRLVL